MTALEEEAEKAAGLIDSLSKQLRYLLGHESDQVALEEELENIREYFHIVSTRYENLYELEIDVPPSCIRLRILKLILQPIVENAVKHGLRPKKGEGKVRISAFKEKGILKIIVMDDGAGMPQEKVEAITEFLHTDAAFSRWIGSEYCPSRPEECIKDIEDMEGKTGTGIGIKNTYDRIVKNYGQEYGFEITSCEGLGTIFEYRLPVLEEEGC